MNSTTSNRQAEEVAVIGSGCAGMGAAFRLQQAGYRVRILEANGYIGGRTKSHKQDGYIIDQGATVVWGNYASVLGIIREAGLGEEVIPGGSVIGVARGEERIYNITPDHPLRDLARIPLTNRSRLKALNLALDAFRQRGRLRFDDLSNVVDLDFESANEYGRRRLTEELVVDFIEPLIRSWTGAYARDISNIDLLFTVANFMGFGVNWVAYRGGIGSYTNLLSNRFDVTLNARVSAVEEVGDRVKVSWSDPQRGERTEEFAGCVIATSANAAAKIEHSGLDDWRRKFLEDVRYTKVISIGIALSKPPRNQLSTIVLLPSRVETFAAVYEHNKASTRAPAGKGLVNLYFSEEYAQDLMDQPDDVILARAIRAVDGMIPRFADDIEFSVVQRWPAAILYTRTGHYRELVKFREIGANDRRIQFAGDYFAPSSQNSASFAGERAAASLLSHMPKSPLYPY